MEEKIIENMTIEKLRENPYGQPIQALVHVEFKDRYRIYFKKSYWTESSEYSKEERINVFKKAVAPQLKEKLENINESFEIVSSAPDNKPLEC